MVVFENSPGRVVALEQGGQAALMSIVNVMGGPRLAFASHRSIVTRLGGRDMVNMQASYSVGDDIYVTVFGDRSGTGTISGISFAAGCEGVTDRHGVESMLDWYRDYKASAYGSPIRIVLGTRTAIDSLLVGMDFEANDTQSLLVSWSATLMTLRDRRIG